MNPRVGPFATDHQAGHLGGAPVVLGHHLVEAGSGTNLASVGQGRSGKHVAGLGAVDVALERLGVVEPADEDHALAIIGQGLQHPAELHLIPRSLGPPLLAVKPVARKQHSQADRGLIGGRRARCSHGIPNRQRLHPGQRHGDAQPPQEFSSRKLRVDHDRPHGKGERDCAAILPLNGFRTHHEPGFPSKIADRERFRRKLSRKDQGPAPRATCRSVPRISRN